MCARTLRWLHLPAGPTDRATFPAPTPELEPTRTSSCLLSCFARCLESHRWPFPWLISSTGCWWLSTFEALPGRNRGLAGVVWVVWTPPLILTGPTPTPLQDTTGICPTSHQPTLELVFPQLFLQPSVDQWFRGSLTR